VRTDRRVEWPDGKDFAFSIFDDTDLATLERLTPVYQLLRDINVRTTKSVWALAGEGTPRVGGLSSDDPAYRAWTLGLQEQGFEIGSHGATYATSPRDKVVASLDQFHEIYGHDPLTLANHTGCAESIYWGPGRVSGFQRIAYNLMTRFERATYFRGHVEGDPLFWGDICRDRIKYVRNFTYSDIDTLAACPIMPYHDPERPYVNAWFASSEGADVGAFNQCIAEVNQDRLEASGGACIMYTHLAKGFAGDGRVDPHFRQLMERLAAKNGWFVPVAELLDYLQAQHGPTVITTAQRRDLERRWLLSKIRVGRT
jgi:hypothetical protein